MKFLTKQGLQHFLDRLKGIIPSKTSDLTNDSGFLTSHNPVDSALSSTSTNAVQNKVVKDALDEKSDTGHTHSASDVSGLSTVATSGSYNDLTNKPTIPTVNNATLTIQKNGSTVKTFTANASSNVTANITVPTKTSDLTNDSGFLTSHNPIDSSLSSTSTNAVQNKVVNDALTGKSDTGHSHTVSDISDFPTLSTVATSGSYNDLSNKPTIPTVNNKTLTIQKNGTNVATFTANSSSNVTANITVPTNVSELTNDSGYLTASSNLDSSKLTGTIDIARLPKGALERLVTVADQTARFALTTSDVQLGDTVKQLDTGVMYIVSDESKLSSNDGYTEYTAGSATSVPWSGVSGKPSSFTPSSHTHGSITNDGKLGTASRALVTDSSKKIAVSSVTSTELGYLSGVTSAIQTQLNGKSDTGHTHSASEVSGLSTVATTGSYDDLSNKPTIPTVNNATLTIQKNGSTVKTFTANASSNVTANITVPTKTSDLTNDSHQTITTGTDSTSTTSPAHGGTFTCIDGITKDTNGHVTAVNVKTVTLPSDNNTDTLVTQNVSTANENHPILLSVTKDAAANQGAKTSIFASGVKVNPSTNTVTATTFSGALSGNASTATQFSANKSVTLTGDVTGTASSKAGWSVATTLANSGVTAGTYGPSADVTGNNNATISVPEITVDAKGRVTSVTNRTLTCKNNTYSVYNKTLTIQKNGTNVATFTSNSNTDVTANITVPTKTSELTNDSGFLTSHQSLSNYVTLNGDQTISGVKTISAKNVKYTASVTRGTSPSAAVYKQPADYVDSAGNRIFLFETVYNTDKSSKTGLYAYNTTAATGNSIGNISIGCDASGNVYTQAPTPATSDNSTKIATTAFVKAQGYLTSHQSLSNYVTLNGAQTISGTKTFSAIQYFNEYKLVVKATNQTIGTTPSSNKWNGMTFQDTAGTNTFTIENGHIKNGTTQLNFSCTPNISGAAKETFLQYYCGTTEGASVLNILTATACAPTPAADDNSTKIATTAFVKAQGYLTSHQSLSNYSTLANTVKSLSISGKTITVTPGSGSAYTLTTQDTVYTHPTTSGNKHIPSGGSSGQFLGWDSDGTAKWVNNPNTNTDTLMTQNVSTTNATYPVLLVATADATANQGAKTGIFAKSVKVNPSTNVISASGFSGPLTGNVTGNCSGSSGSCTGNAATATKLATARAINGTNFDGSAAITTANWGTARNIYIADSDATNTGAAVSVNGSGNATLKLPATIKANITGNCSGSSGSCTGNAATATQFSANKSVTLTGYVNGTASSKAGWSIATALKNGYAYTGGTVTNTYFKIASGTLTGGWNRYETLIRFAETTGNASCTLRVYFSLDGSALFSSGNVTVMDSVNFGTSPFNVVYKNDTDKTLFEIYYQITPKNHQINALVLYETERKTSNTCDVLTMFNQSTPVATLPSDYTLLTTEFELYCGDLVPAGNNKNLGSTDAKWSNVYATTFTGDLTGNVTGNVTGNCSGSSGSCTGNAATATQFSANTTVALTGDATGTSAGSKKGWSVPVTLANSGVTAGTYGPSADVTGNNNATISVPQITVDAKGRVTSVTNRTLTCKNNTYNVYNKTLTIQKNGTNVATFTSNSNTDVTANITVPTKVSELTNDSGFLTSHQSLSNYVTLNGAQTISNTKVFTKKQSIKNTAITNYKAAPSSDTVISIEFLSNDNKFWGALSHTYYTTGHSVMALETSNWSTSGTQGHWRIQFGTDKALSPVYFRPEANNTVDLGDSSHQWKSVYAQSYYYNGTAWGLDKANAWSEHNRFNKNVSLSDVTSYTDCTLGITALNNVIYYNTRGSSNIPSYGTFCYIGYSNTSPYRGGVIQMVRSTDKRGGTNDGFVPDTSFNLWLLQVENKFFDCMEAVRVTNDGSENSLKPIVNNTTDLGTSTNKWKSLNGTNPGALSFPNLEYSDSNKWISIKSAITNTAGADNWYYPAVDGWIFIIASGGAAPDLNVLVFIGSTGTNFISGAIPAAETSTGARWCQCLAPAGSRVRIRFNKGSTSCSIEKALFIPCQGNT